MTPAPCDRPVCETAGRSIFPVVGLQSVSRLAWIADMTITTQSDWQFGPGVVYHCGTEYTTKRRNIELLRLLVEHGGIVEWHQMAHQFGDEYIKSNAINDICNLRKWLRKTFHIDADPLPSYRGYTAWRFNPAVFLAQLTNVSSVNKE